jgi:hypothetical protein
LAVCAIELQGFCYNRKSKFVPRYIPFIEQLDLQALLPCGKVEIQKPATEKQIDLIDTREIE